MSLDPWKPKDGEWSRASAAHLLLRSSLGASERQLSEALSGSPAEIVARWVDRAASMPPRPIASTIVALGREDLLRAAWIERLAEDPAGASPLPERMALLWHGHFATSNAKVDDPVLLQRQIELFRAHGLGDFRELLARVLRDPAMLIWLDGVRNRRRAPNENLARELFELFALGRGHYTERDVQEAARALTGWRVSGRRAIRHEEEFDDGLKTVLGRRGPLDVEALVEVVCEHPACASHVARRLASEFLADSVPQNVVERVASELRTNDWNLAAVLRSLLSSELFFRPEYRGARIASPVAFVVRALRALPLRTPPSFLASATESMGQALLAPPSVEGWHRGRAWIGAAGWIERERTAERLARDSNRIPELAATNADELLELHFPGAQPAWADAFRQMADARRDEPPAPRIRALLTAPEFHLI